MGYTDKSKIVSDRVEIYIAARTADETPVTLPLLSVVDAGGDDTWNGVGAYQGGKLSIKTTKFAVEIQDGTEKKLGIQVNYDVPALQTDTTNLTKLEALQDKTCDVLLRVIGTNKYHLLKKVSVSVGAEMPFDLKNPNAYPVSGQGIFDNFSSCYATGTLASS
jgi:hypothetical protein